MPEPEVDLKKRIKLAGTSVRELADHIGRPYGTVACWLNGFVRMPDEVRSRFEAQLRNTTKSVPAEHR